MNTQEKIEYIVFNKYNLTVLDEKSLLHQTVKLWEEIEEFRDAVEANDLKSIKQELGDVIFVFETLKVLFNVNKVCSNGLKLSESIKRLNKFDKYGLGGIRDFIIKQNSIYEASYYMLLEQTTEKNYGRTGELVNGTFVKSEDL